MQTLKKVITFFKFKWSFKFPVEKKILFLVSNNTYFTHLKKKKIKVIHF